MMWQQITLFFSLLYRLSRVNLQIIYGALKITKLPQPVVTIFGGSKITLESQYALQAHALGKMLVENDISVLTGGGPGIMQAASCGAIPFGKGKGRSIGIGVTELHEKPNDCVQEYFELDYFFARKWLLTRYAVGFVIFPGGFGTLDEFSEVLSLIQTNMLVRVPIILVGSEYWNPFIEWIKNETLQHGFIKKEHMDLIIVADDLTHVLSLVCQKCKVTEPVVKQENKKSD